MTKISLSLLGGVIFGLVVSFQSSVVSASTHEIPKVVSVKLCIFGGIVLTQVPRIAKHPVVRFIPLEKVEVPLGVKLIRAPSVLPIASAVPGLDVPMPILPRESITKAVEVALTLVVVETTKSGTVAPAAPAIERRPSGLLVAPIPMVPSSTILKRVEEALFTTSKTVVGAPAEEVAITVSVAAGLAVFPAGNCPIENRPNVSSHEILLDP
jgi:hypothetical protein